LNISFIGNVYITYMEDLQEGTLVASV